MKIVGIGTGLLIAAALMLGGALGAGAQDTGTVTVVHGVPGLTVDVYVNGDLTLEAFEPGDATDPLALPAGDYDIEVFATGADPEADSPAIADTVTLPAGANASVVAHLTEAGDPTLTAFVNDVSEIEAGNARLTVRHTAAAPAVTILAGGSPVFEDLANPDEAAADVPAGDYSVAVVPAPSTDEADSVIGPADLTLEEGTAYFVYAIGSVEDETLDLVVQTIADLGAAEATATPEPTEEAADLPQSGVGPDAGASLPWLAIIVAIGGAVALAGGLGLAAARNR